MAYLVFLKRFIQMLFEDNWIFFFSDLLWSNFKASRGKEIVLQSINVL